MRFPYTIIAKATDTADLLDVASVVLFALRNCGAEGFYIRVINRMNTPSTLYPDRENSPITLSYQSTFLMSVPPGLQDDVFISLKGLNPGFQIDPSQFALQILSGLSNLPSATVIAYIKTGE